MVVGPGQHTDQLNEALTAEKTALEMERRQLHREVADKEARLLEIERRLEHVNGLLGEDSGALAPEPLVDILSSRANSVEIAHAILSERNREPMYYKDLAKEVVVRGGDISGANAAQILVARLVRDDRFIRPVRKGFYALRDDYPNAQNVGARKRGRRKS